jgi:hypothetical protein
MAQKSDLQLAYEALSGKAENYRTLWQYYDGDQPLTYSTERLDEIFRGLKARFTQNWCAVVVDAMLDRLNLARWQVAGSDDAAARLNELYQETELHLDSEDAHLAALVCGEAFIVAWPNEDDGTVEAFYNDPCLCHIQYDPANPRRKLWAAKWWEASDGTYRLTLYYEDRLEYYGTRKAARQVSNWKAFEPGDPPQAENPYGVIPVFHLRRTRRAVTSELANAIRPQDAINKLLADMMVAAEFGAFRQRWAISNADLGTLKNAPNEIWSLPAGDGVGQGASVGEFSQTDLGVYLNAMDKLATSIAIITRTPKHYFFAQGGDPSGEALIAMESPLNRKCQRCIDVFGATWRQVGAFLLTLDGWDVAEADVEPQFDVPETVQPRTEAEIRHMSVGAGLPLVTVLRAEGWTDAEIEQMEEDKATEQDKATASLAQALMEQQRRAEQWQPAGAGEPGSGGAGEPGSRGAEV